MAVVYNGEYYRAGMGSNVDADRENLTRGQVEVAVESLVDEYRARCLWFLRADFRPTSDAERMVALRAIARYGDRAAFVRARELQEWLLRSSSDTTTGFKP